LAQPSVRLRWGTGQIRKSVGDANGRGDSAFPACGVWRSIYRGPDGHPDGQLQPVQRSTPTIETTALRYIPISFYKYSSSSAPCLPGTSLLVACIAIVDQGHDLGLGACAWHLYCYSEAN